MVYVIDVLNAGWKNLRDGLTELGLQQLENAIKALNNGMLPNDVMQRTMDSVVITAPWQMRVWVERREVLDRLKKLDTFIETKGFDDLPTDEQERLKRQQKIMQDYVDTLDERIANFS